MLYIFRKFHRFYFCQKHQKACKINVFRCFTGFSEYRRRWDSNRLAAVFKNNGIQKRDDLYMLNGTKPTAIMLETFFCDSSADCALAEKTDVALLIAEGIHGGKISHGNMNLPIRLLSGCCTGCNLDCGFYNI